MYIPQMPVQNYGNGSKKDPILFIAFALCGMIMAGALSYMYVIKDSTNKNWQKAESTSDGIRELMIMHLRTNPTDTWDWVYVRSEENGPALHVIIGLNVPFQGEVISFNASTLPLVIANDVALDLAIESPDFLRVVTPDGVEAKATSLTPEQAMKLIETIQERSQSVSSLYRQFTR